MSTWRNLENLKFLEISFLSLKKIRNIRGILSLNSTLILSLSENIVSLIIFFLLMQHVYNRLAINVTYIRIYSSTFLYVS